jgi:hypothetical protein
VGALNFGSFQEARLIPVTGIKGAIDQERRATSALLAVMRIVPELSQALLKPLGAPVGAIASYIEPEFKLNGRKIRPDGLITVQRGTKTWTALVEVKTGKNELQLDQINSYLDICKTSGLDALITISNQVLNASGQHPTPGVDLRKLKSTKLQHYSWIKLITESIVLSEHVGVADNERDLILKELIRFLQSDASGASEFNDMGSAWPSVREAIRTSSLRKPDADVLNIVSNFESLIRYSALTLSARLGVAAREVVPKSARLDYKKHLSTVATRLIIEKKLAGEIDVPGAAARLEMEADLGSGILHCSASVTSPSEGRNRSRISWVLRQLKANPATTYLQWNYKHARIPEQPHLVANLLDKDYEFSLAADREIVSFRIEMMSKMGTSRSSGKGSFIDSIVELFEQFYGQILQDFKPWQDPAPKLSDKVLEIIPTIEPHDAIAESRDPAGL